MAKDRAAPFSRKHLRVWLPVTGGMLLIGAINLALGWCTKPDAPTGPMERIIPVVPTLSWPALTPLDAAPAPPVDGAVR